MTRLKLLLYLVFVLIIALLGWIFASRNDTLVALDFLVTKIPSISLGRLVILSFLAGALLSCLVFLPKSLIHKIARKHYQQKANSQRNELLKLKGEPAEGR